MALWKFLAIVVVAAVSASTAQLITPAPVAPPGLDGADKLRRQVDTSFAAAFNRCHASGAPCRYPDYSDACAAEWKDMDYLWCLCTTGYYEALQSCISPLPFPRSSGIVLDLIAEQVQRVRGVGGPRVRRPAVDSHKFEQRRL